MTWTRRRFLQTASSAAAVTAVSASLPKALAAYPRPYLPSPNQSGIQHIIVVMMENRSFDHMLGWLGGANGKQHNSYLDPNGVAHNTYDLAPDYEGCGYKDPDHSYDGARIQYDGGKMDGFLLDPNNDQFAIGYYGEKDLPFYAALAKNYTSFDRYHCSILGPTFPNRIFFHAAQTDRITNSTTLSTLPTIWDRLSAAGVSANYYFSNVPFLALWGAKYLPISKTYQQFLLDAQLGTLPAFSFIDPRYTVLDDGTGNDDHPHADMRAGELFLSEVYNAVVNSPAWPNTVIVFTWDEWGGFFDHVAPPRVVAPNNVDPDIVNGQVLLGFRVPVVVASPFTRGNANHPRVDHALYDHTSVLKLVEWRWGLKPLTKRDASSQITNLANALNFSSPNATAASLPTPPPIVPVPCPQGTIGTAEDTFLQELVILARQNGWPV